MFPSITITIHTLTGTNIIPSVTLQHVSINNVIMRETILSCDENINLFNINMSRQVYNICVWDIKIAIHLEHDMATGNHIDAML